LAVSCTSASACTAVGDWIKAGTGKRVTLAEVWDGTAWTVQPTPNPTGNNGSVLSGVSCTSASACTAVGYWNRIKDGTVKGVTLAEAWDGTAWTVQPTPNPGGKRGSALSAVSCTSNKACAAVGQFYLNPSVAETLAEAWNGTAWTVQATPNPTSMPNNVLSGVSCTSNKACTAVGSSFGGIGSTTPFSTLAEAWDGTAWTVQATPNPTGLQASLLGVSCTTVDACTAVGYSFTAPGPHVQTTLAEAWDGTAWTVQATPNPTGRQFPTLSGVSCTTDTACTAIGDSFKASTDVTLAERRS
jgi:hypothetical protein